jgi:hypothetical protein
VVGSPERIPSSQQLPLHHGWVYTM